MVRIAFFIGFLALFIGGLTPNTVRADDSTYYIKDVQVDILDESSVKARNKAFIEAQKKAFLMLAARFEPAETLAALKPPSEDVLSGLIQDFEISSEQLSTKRYLGVFAFRFKPAAVNQYFGHAPNNSSENSSNGTVKTLLLPFTQQLKGTPQISKLRNPFLTMLQADLPKDGSYILPAGNISDITDIGREEPPMISSSAMRRLMARYEVQDIKIAVVHIDPRNQQSVGIEVFDTAKGTRIIKSKSMTVAPAKASSSTYEALTETFSSVTDAEPLETEQSKFLQSEINPEHFMPKSRALPTDHLRDLRYPDVQPDVQTNTQTVSGEEPQVTTTVNSEISIKVFFTNMSEWLSIQKQLSKTDGLKNIKIVSLKTNQVDLVTTYDNWNLFTTSLQNNGLTLEHQSDRAYILKRLGGNF